MSAAGICRASSGGFVSVLFTRPSHRCDDIIVIVLEVYGVVASHAGEFRVEEAETVLDLVALLLAEDTPARTQASFFSSSHFPQNDNDASCNFGLSQRGQTPSFIIEVSSSASSRRSDSFGNSISSPRPRTVRCFTFPSASR